MRKTLTSFMRNCGIVYIQFALHYIFFFFKLTGNCADMVCDQMCFYPNHFYPCSHRQCTVPLTRAALYVQADMCLTHHTVGACLFTPHSRFIACDLMVILWATIASFFHPLLPTAEITGSVLIHKTHRTTLESLLQFELSNHNGRMRLPFFARRVCVYVWVNVDVEVS